MARRLLFSLISTVFLVLCLLYLGLSSDDDEIPNQPQEPNRPGSRLSYHGPSSIFSPSATISLTEDNSTFFAARPAAFGPSLPDSGLSGQVWIGSGFGESNIRRRGIAASVEGELGCSDIPDWSHEKWYDEERVFAVADSLHNSFFNTQGHDNPPSTEKDRHSQVDAPPLTTSIVDRTDNHLHFPLVSTSVARSSRSTPQQHADIQSLQESAEIAGKIVLLSRGGCGFLEKIKWAQRRGATAVIVGDNLRGGPLIRMYAQDDTSNITIPSLFTSHTTAHLLSSLVPMGYNFGTASTLPTRASKPNTRSPKKLKSKSTRPRFSSLVDSSSAKMPGREDDHLRGGHITPGSGVYETSQDQNAGSHADKINNSPSSGNSTQTPNRSRGWFDALSWAVNRDESSEKSRVHGKSMKSLDISDSSLKEEFDILDGQEHDMRNGLWVTLSPSSMDPSPFLNTLFVLVISPLVTLGIVYTMLIIRARIRRRRWRAPKSLVERLPVRVFHTLQRTSSTNSEQSQSEQHTSTTPLLAGSRATEIGQRPRSATISGVSGSMGSSYRYGSLEPSTAEQEKINNGLAEWRRRYVGRQIECAVCLEEYVDGVSQVMSLPCGHEFHVDCITPWLTTRRRTCPICKGDVVRSMTGGPPLSDDGGPPDESSEESIQQQIGETVNASPSAALPIPSSATHQDFSFDLESGHLREATPAHEQRPSWLTAIIGPGRRSGGTPNTGNGDNNTSTTPDRDR